MKYIDGIMVEDGLTKEEKVILREFLEILKQTGLYHCFKYGDGEYGEGIFWFYKDDDNKWKSYIYERGVRTDYPSFDSLYDFCMNAFKADFSKKEGEYCLETFPKTIKEKLAEVDEITFFEQAPSKPKEADLSSIIEMVLKDPEAFYTRVGEILSPEEKNYIASCASEYVHCGNCRNRECLVEPKDVPPEGCKNWKNDAIIGQYKVLGLTKKRRNNNG